MKELSFDTVTLGFMQAFERMTSVRPKDCIVVEEKVVFLVCPGDVKKAVGPKGETVERLKELMKREIQVVAFSTEPEKLVMNLFYPFSPVGVEFETQEAGRHATVQVAEGWKARAIGKSGKNLKVARAMLLRHTDIVSIKVA